MRVFIDPGHGGKDPGATGNRLQEKDVVLELALALAQVLEAYDCQVKLARDKDVYLSLGERTKAANDWGADLYFSVHINGHSNVEANGYEDFTYPNVSQTTTSIRNAIHVEVAPVWTSAGRANRGMKTANFQVLRETRMPAVLLENGFITNARDAELLKDPAFRGRLVEAMSKGIVEGLSLEKKETHGTPILGTPQASVAQAREWARGRKAHQRFIDIAPAYWEIGHAIGIRPEVAYCQAAKETAFGRYGGAVKPEWNNWAGIKTATAAGDRPEDHETFPTPEDGVRAHFNHLAAYVGVPPLGEPHGRYHIVKGLNWAGTVRYVEELGGKWAPSSDYGRSIVQDYLVPMMMTKIDEPCPEPEYYRLRQQNEYLYKENAALKERLNKISELVKL